MLKKIFAAMCVLAMAGCSSAASTAASASSVKETGTADVQETAASEENAESTGYGIHHAEITIKDYGTITLELDGDTAPITVENFVTLANDGFYDGLTFHRIMDGFMIQGGDPLGNGTGGSGKQITGEFAANGIPNDISHKMGVISMARNSRSMDSASSQFFICVADAVSLDGQYAAFGHVTEGLEIALQIARDANPIDRNGTILKEEQPVIESVKILD